MTRSLLAWVLAATSAAGALAACLDTHGTREAGSGGASSTSSSKSGSTSSGTQTSTSTGTVFTGASCQEIHQANPMAPSGVYTITSIMQGTYEVYCEMDADDGGWTLVLKIDGTGNALQYGDSLWKNNTVLNGGSPGLTPLETAKYASYSDLPVTDLRLGMIDPQTQAEHWIVAHLTTKQKTLLDLISSGTLQTNLGASTWQGLLPGANLSLQTCVVDGINVPGNGVSATQARIGIVAGGGGSCSHPSTSIGFGLIGLAGELASGNYQEGGTDIRAFGYVMVR